MQRSRQIPRRASSQKSRSSLIKRGERSVEKADEARRFCQTNYNQKFLAIIGPLLWLYTRKHNRQVEARRPVRANPLSPDELGRVLFGLAQSGDAWRTERSISPVLRPRRSWVNEKPRPILNSGRALSPGGV